MDTTESINERIAKNLTYYRKTAGFTQAELAQMINYSDKSVSKWESGNGIPDVYILLKLAEIYGVSISDITGDGNAEPKVIGEGKSTRFIIALLSSGLVWLVATIGYVLLELFAGSGMFWLAFLYAVPFNAVLVIVFASVWHKRTLNFFAISVLIWSFLTCTFFTCWLIVDSLRLDTGSLWTIFLVGVPLQILTVLWFFLRKKKSKKNAVDGSTVAGR